MLVAAFRLHILLVLGAALDLIQLNSELSVRFEFMCVALNIFLAELLVGELDLQVGI